METDTLATQSWVIDTLRRALEAMATGHILNDGDFDGAPLQPLDASAALATLPPREPAPACTTFYDRNWSDEPVLCDTPGVMEVPSYHHCPDSICANPNGCGKRRDEHPPHVKPAPKPAGLPEIEAVAYDTRIGLIPAHSIQKPIPDIPALVPESTARAYEAALAESRRECERLREVARIATAELCVQANAKAEQCARAEQSEAGVASAEARGHAAGYAEAREQARELMQERARDTAYSASFALNACAADIATMQPKAVKQ